MYVKALVHINSLKSKDNACSKTNGAIAMVFVAKKNHVSKYLFYLFRSQGGKYIPIYILFHI